jgi:hypothetical protein
MNMLLFDLYVDYLISSTSYTTATGFSAVMDNAFSHDQATRLLSAKDVTSRDLWLNTKSFYKQVEDSDGVLIVDDTIEEKPYTDENEVIAWHWSHKDGRSIKGLNFTSLLYNSNKGSCVVAFEPVRKDLNILDEKTGKTKRQASVSKHEHFRNMVKFSVANNVNFRYILGDVWFASAENMNFIVTDCQKHLVMAVKGNNLVALSEEDKALGKFVRIDSLELEEGKTVRKQGVDFPLRLVRQVFKNEDGSTGVLYLASSDLELTDEQIKTIYKRRWKVETYHESLKVNCSLSKSPGKSPRTQLTHLFASMCAYNRLEKMSNNQNKNHFALKMRIYLAGLKVSMMETFKLKLGLPSQSENINWAPA